MQITTPTQHNPVPARPDSVIPAKGPVAKHTTEAFETTTAYFVGLAMTEKRRSCHCEEQSDEAISTLATGPKAPNPDPSMRQHAIFDSRFLDFPLCRARRPGTIRKEFPEMF